MKLRIWFRETRPGFLLLTPITFSVGLSAAFAEGSFDTLRALLGFVGALLAHLSVNVINDYFDYRSGLDLRTRRTPFSGGSGILPEGLLKPKDTYLFAVGCMLIGGVIGIYFTLTTGWMLLPLIAMVAFTIYFYSTHLSHWFVGEVFTGLNFGPLMVLGGYFIQTGRYSLPALAAGVVPGILVGTLILVGFIVFMYSYRLAGKVKYLTDVTDRISVGDLDAEIVGIQSNDEIGELANALKRMQASIRLAIQRLRERR